MDISLLTKKGLKWVDAKGSNAQAVADYVLYNLAKLHHDGLCHWPDPTRPLKAAVVGCGHVGQAMLWRLNHLGFETYGCDPLIDQNTLAQHCDQIVDDQHLAWLQSMDLLSIHLPHTTQGSHPTVQWLNSKKIQLLKNKCLVVLAGRGENVDEQAMLQEAPRLLPIIDVWPKEPYVSCELIRAAKIATPHIAGHSKQGKAKGAWMIIEALMSHLRMQSPVTAQEFSQKCLKGQVSPKAPKGESQPISSELISIDKQFIDVMRHCSSERLGADEFYRLRKNYLQHEELVFNENEN